MAAGENARWWKRSRREKLGIDYYAYLPETLFPPEPDVWQVNRARADLSPS